MHVNNFDRSGAGGAEEQPQAQRKKNSSPRLLQGRAVRCHSQGGIKYSAARGCERCQTAPPSCPGVERCGARAEAEC